MERLSRIPWWAAFPTSIGLSVMGVFAPTFLPNWAQITFFVGGAASLLWGMAATCWHLRFRRGLLGEGAPNLAIKPADRDTTLHQGLSYAVFRDWFLRSNADESSHSKEFEGALGRFHELALAGRLQSWGRPYSLLQTNHFRLIPPEHWGGNEVDFLSAMLPQSSTVMKISGIKGFDEVMVNRAQFEREWPHGR